jgi:hypothetical protein
MGCAPAHITSPPSVPYIAGRARSTSGQRGVAFWTAALDGVEEETSETSREIYRRIRLPDSEIRILLQKPVTARYQKSECTLIWKRIT